jgi:hypothetical protein
MMIYKVLIMGIDWLKQKTRFLTWLLLLASAYSGLLYIQISPTGVYRLDGTIGVVMGIYICAHPAANVLDFILYGRHLLLEKIAIRPMVLWWLLNSVVMFLGLLVFVLGLLRFSEFS